MNLDHRIVYATHVFLVAPLLWHVSTNRYTADDRLFALKVLAVLIIIHHGQNYTNYIHQKTILMN